MFTKVCSMCNKNYTVLKVEDFTKYFHKAKLGKFGFTARCKGCRSRVENIYQRPSKAKERDQIPCIVCDQLFTPRDNRQVTCCEEHSKLRGKIWRRLNSIKYTEQNRNLAEKERDRENTNKKYTQKEIDYILRNRGVLSLRQIAKRLNRTTRSIILKINLINKKGVINGTNYNT